MGRTTFHPSPCYSSGSSQTIDLATGFPLKQVAGGREALCQTPSEVEPSRPVAAVVLPRHAPTLAVLL
jgi:hypothetical protein